MSSFGEHLRQQREMRGISLDEIVATTKIGRRLLLALEEEQFDLLPGGIFNKSYVRAYAKCIGIDEEGAVAEYLEAAKETPPDTKVIAHQHASLHSDRPRERSSFPLVPVLVLLAIATGGVAGWKVYRQHQREREREQSTAQASSGETQAMPGPAPSSSGEPQPKHEVAPENVRQSIPSDATPAQSPTPTTTLPSAGGAVHSAAPSEAPAGPSFEVTVRPKERAWVSIKSDGKYLVRGIIQPPEVKTVRANSQIVFFTGNAGAVDVDFNGQNIPLSGGANEEQVLVFGPRGLAPKAAAP